MSIDNNVKISVFSYKGSKNKKAMVGWIEGDIYYSERRPKHFFRIFKGYGLGIDVYNFLIEQGVKTIKLYYGHKFYESDISQWKHSSRWDNEINNTEKIDPQYILEEDKMLKYYMKTYSYELKGGAKMDGDNIDFTKIGPIQGTSVDLTKYDKLLTTIEKVEIIQLPSSFTPLIIGTQVHLMQWVLKVSSVVLESIREGIDKIEFRATEIFNLVQDEKGTLKGFPTGDGAKLMKFLKDMKVSNPQEMKSIEEIKNAIVGKQAVIKAETKERDGKTNTYLRFRY